MFGRTGQLLGHGHFKDVSDNLLHTEGKLPHTI